MRYKTRKRLQCFIADTILIILLVWFLCMLTGCASKSEVVTNTAEAAKETITVAIKQKPECADVGEACNSQIDAVVATCEQEMKLKIKETRERSLKEGAGFATIGIILLWIVMKRLFK